MYLIAFGFYRMTPDKRQLIAINEDLDTFLLDRVHSFGQVHRDTVAG